MRELYITLLSILIVVLYSSCFSDLRPKSLTGDGATRNNQASIALLRASKTHGYSHWARMRDYECMVNDSFIGFVGKRGSPFTENQATLQCKFTRGTKSGSFEIISGKEQGHIWSHNSYNSTITKGDSIINAASKEAEFWVPTYQYFIEFPFRIIEATALELLEDKTRKGKKYTRVLASWNTTEVQDNIDQYVVWINKDMRIDYIEYTIRDQFKFLKGSAEYVEYDLIDGIYFPVQIDIFSNLTGRKMLHQIKISNIEVGK